MDFFVLEFFNEYILSEIIFFFLWFECCKFIKIYFDCFILSVFVFGSILFLIIWVNEYKLMLIFCLYK